MAQAPIAITYFGSAIWSYNLFKTGPILFTMVPAIMITSAWRGVALATSKPKREKSYLAEAVAIISIPQQLVAKVSGHKELALAQLIRSSSLLNATSVPPTLCTWPGNEASPKSPPGEGTFKESALFEKLLLILYSVEPSLREGWGRGFLHPF